jgi:protein TonB
LPPHGHWADDYIPEKAARTNETGGAVVVCIAEASGAFGDCWVQSQSPADAGYGDAVLRIIKRARMKSLTVSHAAVAGRPYVHVFKYAGWGLEPPVGAFEPHWAP